jgi:hypothetical protein
LTHRELAIPHLVERAALLCRLQAILCEFVDNVEWLVIQTMHRYSFGVLSSVDIALGIGVTVAQPTLDRLVKVQILYPQLRKALQNMRFVGPSFLSVNWDQTGSVRVVLK